MTQTVLNIWPRNEPRFRIRDKTDLATWLLKESQSYLWPPKGKRHNKKKERSKKEMSENYFWPSFLVVWSSHGFFSLGQLAQKTKQVYPQSS